VTPDATLLGGFVARVGSEIYDASVVGKIDKFRESLA
jgi:F0F1-type ATP synthase delta subunit